MKVLNKKKATLASLTWRELKANQFIHELTTPLIIKLRLVVKNTHTEVLLLSESLETKASSNHLHLSELSGILNRRNIN